VQFGARQRNQDFLEKCPEVILLTRRQLLDGGGERAPPLQQQPLPSPLSGGAEVKCHRARIIAGGPSLNQTFLNELIDEANRARMRQAEDLT
jgi:hypothetical protein